MFNWLDVSPGATRTPIFDKYGYEPFNLQNIMKMGAQSFPLGRIGEAIDCAKAVAYLASDDASFVTGILMPIDGGSLFANMLAPKDLKTEPLMQTNLWFKATKLYRNNYIPISLIQ